MTNFKPGDRVWVKSHHRDIPRIVKEVAEFYVLCTLPDRTDYKFPHDALELVTPDPSREVKPKSARRIPVGHQNFIPRFLGVNKNEFRHPVRSLDT